MVIRRRWSMRSGTIALVVALASTACSGGDEATEPPSMTIASTTTTAPAPTTTTMATSTTMATPPEWTDDELAVIAAYEAFQATYVEGVLLGNLPFESLDSVTSAEFGAALRDILEQDRAAGLVAAGEVRFTIDDVDVRPDIAEINVCIWDRISLIDGDQEVVAAAPEPVRSTAHLVLDDGRWVLDGTETLTPAVPCSVAE